MKRKIILISSIILLIVTLILILVSLFTPIKNNLTYTYSSNANNYQYRYVSYKFDSATYTQEVNYQGIKDVEVFKYYIIDEIIYSTELNSNSFYKEFEIINPWSFKVIEDGAVFTCKTGILLFSLYVIILVTSGGTIIYIFTKRNKI